MQNLHLDMHVNVLILLKIKNIHKNLFYLKIENYVLAHVEIFKEFQGIKNCKIIFQYFINLSFNNFNYLNFL
jgi:hypothetical protein